MEPARCAWEVTAGLIPGQPMPEYTKRWVLTAYEWKSPRGGDLLLERMGSAMAYAVSMQNPRTRNWVRLDWVWF